MSKGGGRVVGTIETIPENDLHSADWFERKSNREARWQTFKATTIIVLVAIAIGLVVQSLWP
jgi:hypothetical protein